MGRGIAYNRDVSIRKALRKRNITQQVYYYTGHPYYDNLHQYSKNKIHCSCPMCSSKTKNKGQKKHNRWAPSVNYKVSDKRKLHSLFGDDSYDFFRLKDCIQYIKDYEG